METKFQQLDLVKDAKGELYVVQGESFAHPGLYEAVSLQRPDGVSYVSDKEERRICSLHDLPTAVRSLLTWRKYLDHGQGAAGSFGTHLTTAIRILDQLRAILAEEEED
jgi:hypothetical protein